MLNYRKWPRGPYRNSMNCVTCRYVIRTSPGGADAHMRTHDGEIEVPTLEPSHRRVKNTHTYTHTHTHTFESPSGKAEKYAEKRVGPMDDKHVTA